jgi:carbamoyl-phosphate synthase large subunit
MVQDGELNLIVNTPIGITKDGSPRLDGYEIRSAAVARNIPCITTVQGLGAAVQGIEAQQAGDIGVRSLQDWASRIRGDADGAPDDGRPAAVAASPTAPAGYAATTSLASPPQAEG